jgi:aspartyl-tRNA(Asn)/glutamyl-tRNA(Gln) amidotransferase subunit A
MAPMSDLVMLPMTRLSAMLDAGETDAVTLTRACLDRITGPGHALNAFITLCADSALREAEASRARGTRRLGPLDGIPVALKDNIDAADVPTSNGFGGAPWRLPDQDAEITRRLREAGAVILGKLNMHEGALGATTNNAHHGRCLNPHDTSRSPGGSSGGSGAAVAAGLCVAALGTDTGGSIRIPAAYCGVVGLKPSFGLISTRGVVPLSYPLDHAGPLTRTVSDAALMLGVLAGFDPACTESRPGPVMPSPPSPGALKDVRLAVLDNFDVEPTEPAVLEAFAQALTVLRSLGATVDMVHLPGYDPVRGRRAGFLRVEAEAAQIHGALYGREPDRFSAEMKAYLDYGARMPAVKLLDADRIIQTAAFEMTQLAQRYDAVISPATPQVAPAFADRPPDNAGSYSILANFAGLPSISVPMGRDPSGLPLGLQITARHHDEAGLLRIATAYEAASHYDMRPPGF